MSLCDVFVVIFVPLVDGKGDKEDKEEWGKVKCGGLSYLKGSGDRPTFLVEMVADLIWSGEIWWLWNAGGVNVCIMKLLPAAPLYYPFSIGAHFYHGVWVWFDDFINIRKGLWKSED